MSMSVTYYQAICLNGHLYRIDDNQIEIVNDLCPQCNLKPDWKNAVANYDDDNWYYDDDNWYGEINKANLRHYAWNVYAIPTPEETEQLLNNTITFVSPNMCDYEVTNCYSMGIIPCCEPLYYPYPCI
jgi:hypothetical protein